MVRTSHSRNCSCFSGSSGTPSLQVSEATGLDGGITAMTGLSALTGERGADRRRLRLLSILVVALVAIGGMVSGSAHALTPSLFDEQLIADPAGGPQFVA